MVINYKNIIQESHIEITMTLNDFSDKYFDQNDFLDSKDREKLLELVQFVTIPKDKILLHRGEQIKQVGIILKGLIRVYNKNNRTVWFVQNNGIYGSIDTLALNRASSLTFETLEETSMFLLNYDDLEEAIISYPNIASLLLMYWKRTAVEIYRNFYTSLSLSPEEKYLEILQKNPQLILNVKSKDLASYLGIHPTSLSRLKKRYFVSKENKT